MRGAVEVHQRRRVLEGLVEKPQALLLGQHAGDRSIDDGLVDPSVAQQRDSGAA